MEQGYNPDLARQAQAKYQKEHNAPDFAPRDGFCYRCKKNIYAPINHGSYTTGITVEKASTQLITGCPHCHASYVD